MSLKLDSNNSISLLPLINNLRKNLRNKRFKKIYFSFIVIFLTGIFESLTLTLVGPFLTSISNQNLLYNNKFIIFIFNNYGFIFNNEIVLLCILLFCVSAFLAAIFRVYSLWLNTKLASIIASDLSCDAYRNTIYQEYLVHINRNSSETITAITTHVNYTHVFINSILQLLSSIVASAFIVITLLIVNWKIAILLSIFCGSIIGACLGFLWFNAPPAKIFMGDTGSLSLGGSLGAIGIITKHEIVLAITGGLFVLEALSVVVQVVSFKLTGKRIFKMAPIHHHFEKKGWPESTVVIRFWIISIILAVIGLATLKLR